ncbi:hypothetical protein PENDEC_c008G00202 [Penicillium decumbens]|uniref:Uncharacterized protein n=1 Tax=Penicillium decumbens TaxID=69771 RepID=A0A1V6PEM2_PENDC|nr:hypothetical protein PENDEC_c008G00202 [Penicillium decumbens]
MSTSATHEAGAYPKSLSTPFTFSKTLLFKTVDKGSRRFWD